MRRFLSLSLLVLATTPGLAFAGGDPPLPAPQRPAPSSPDFFFAPPRGSVSIRGSWDLLQANSDWFGFVRRQLTLNRGDFRMFGFAADVNVGLTPRFDVVVSGDFAGHAKDSEYRDFVDSRRNPIGQTTRLREGSIAGGVRYALLPRGQAVSSLAWIPSRLVPYVGGGGGVLFYDLTQYGDFVDFTDFSIFSDQLKSTGAAPMAYVNAGADLQLIKHVYATVDARYKWARPKLDPDVWTGFDPLSLGGVRISTGLSISY
jgi:hypothetical protein